jgi:hypothetical protein
MRSARRCGAALALAVTLMGSGPSLAASQASVEPMAPQAGSAGAERAPRTVAASGRQTGSPLERRVALLAAELNLSDAQQIQVKAALQRQREAVLKAWNDDTLAPAVRIGRTQAISERTVNDIRALLDEEQRKKYIQPRQREAMVGTGGPDVESWMKSGKLTAGPP